MFVSVYSTYFVKKCVFVCNMFCHDFCHCYSVYHFMRNCDQACKDVSTKNH